MSAGSFSTVGYETDSGDIRPIRVQPESIVAGDNPAATGALTGGRVRVSGSGRALGTKARFITLKQNVGAPVAGYQATRPARVPVFTPAAFEALTEGNDFTYNGSVWKISGKIKESGK